MTRIKCTNFTYLWIVQSQHFIQLTGLENENVLKTLFQEKNLRSRKHVLLPLVDNRSVIYPWILFQRAIWTTKWKKWVLKYTWTSSMSNLFLCFLILYMSHVQFSSPLSMFSQQWAVNGSGGRRLCLATKNKTQVGSRTGGENKRSGEVEIVVVRQRSEGGNIIHFHANTLLPFLHSLSLVVFCW